MKRFLLLATALIFLMCIPVYADESEYGPGTIDWSPASASETASGSQTPDYKIPDIAGGATTGNLGDSRIEFNYSILIPNDAMAKGLDPVYRVGSSYIDDNGETWYVTVGPKQIQFKASECTVQNYYDLDTDNLIRQQVVSLALERLGCPYVYGKSGPQSFDCSGFVQYCMSVAGVAIPRSSYQICQMETKIDKEMLKAGDIVATSGHAGIYIGNGCFVHAQDHGNGVVTDYLDVYNLNSYKKFKYYINVLD